MSNIQLILICITLLISASLEGINNSLITARKGFDGYSFNEHIIFVLQRSCFVALFFILLNWKDASLISIIFILIFSFFHNGFYGVSMKKLGFKNYSWTYTSSTSTAKLELNFVVRSILLILGIIILIYKLTN